MFLGLESYWQRQMTALLCNRAARQVRHVMHAVHSNKYLLA
jgi:hypothetical protein